MNLNIVSFLIVFFIFVFIIYPPYIKNSTSSLTYTKEYRLFSFFMFGIFLVFFYMMRKLFIGYDTYSYVSVFENIANCSAYKEISERHIAMGWEKLFVRFIYLISRISDNKYFFLFVIGTCLYFSIIYFITSLSKNFLISIIFFVLYGFYFSSTNLMRQFCAISIVLFGVNFFLKKKYVRYYIVIFLASFFHTTALICVLLPIINIFKLKKSFIVFYFFVMTVLIFFSNNLLSFAIHYVAPQYESYFTSSSFGILSKSKLGSLLNLFIGVILFIYFYSNYNEKDEIYSKLLKIFMFGLLFTAASAKFTQIGRIASYFSPSAFILISMGKKNILFYFTFFILIVYCVIVNLFRPEWTGFFPYYFDF